MTLEIAKHRRRRLILVGALLFSLLAVSSAIATRFTSSEDGKPWWQVAIDHAMQNKDIGEKWKEVWAAIRNLYRDHHPRIPRTPPP
jgi:hypothetical protein